MITILDYGAGNLRSVQNTLSEIGVAFEVTDDPADIRRASRIILPGVGHFGQMMRTLDAMRMRQTLIDRIRGGAPFLGICLGLQALFSASDEAPDIPGLGIYEGTVRRFSNSVRVPHMGWDSLETVKESRLLEGTGIKPHVYFANSYYAPVTPECVATCTYEVPFAAVIEAENVYAVQFHPEKSGPTGLRIVKNFVDA